MDVVLGLDVSTSIIGWSIVAVNTKVSDGPVKDGYIDLRKVKDGFWAKVDIVKKELDDLLNEIHDDKEKFHEGKWNLVRIFIEDPVKKFKKGASSADTISLLGRFNALVSYFVRDIGMCGDPEYIEVSRARGTIGLKLLSRKKAAGLGHKEQTFSQLSKTVFNDRVWEVNRNGKIQPWCWDICDAFVIAAAGVIHYKSKEM